MKKILFIIFVFMSVLIIYMKYSTQKKLILSFGNINAEYNYTYDDTRITDIINFINNNGKIKNRNIQNILIKATYVYIDLNDLIKCDNYQIAINNINDLEKLVALIRKYCKEKIVIKFIEDNDNLSTYVNEKVMITLKKYDIIFMR